jgi:glutamate-1-semialdehyde 2,1-aminomutase
LKALEALPDSIVNDTAAVILEPVAANMGLVPPNPGFLEGLREWTQQRGILLILDEVITGFRLCFGGAQKELGIRPDLTCLGKIVGGGMPLAAYGGRSEIMQKVAPLGPVYQAGTLSGNPVAVSAGLAALQLLRDESCYQLLRQKSGQFLYSIQSCMDAEKLPVSLVSLGSMFTFFFRESRPSNFQEAKQSNTKRYANFFWNTLEKGIYVAPSQFETNFVSMAHSEQDLAEAAAGISQALREACRDTP